MDAESNPPCSDNSLNARLEFDDSDFGSLVQRNNRHIQDARQTSEAV